MHGFLEAGDSVFDTGACAYGKVFGTALAADAEFEDVRATVTDLGPLIS